MTKPFDIQRCKQYVNKVFDETIIKQLSDFIAIPNLSKAYDKDYATNGLLQKAASHIKKFVDSMQIKGATCEIIKHQGYTPILFTQIQGDIKQRTIFFYGHFDKQPPMTGWDQGKGPTIPVIQNGLLYGRGGADDGYSTYSSMLAIKTCQQQGIPIPRCVMLTQGDQQSGGHIDYYIQQMKARIGNPEVIFCLDSGTYDYERLWLTNSLRGVLNFVMTVSNIKQGVHSGDASGIVPSVSRIANLLVQRIQNLQTGKVHEAFHVDIPSNRYQETYKIAEILKTCGKQFQVLEGVKYASQNNHELVLNRTWRPQLTITGITGLSPVKCAGNVMIPSLTQRLSLRLPPTLNPQKAQQKLKQILLKDVPFGAHVVLSDFSAGSGWNAPDCSEWLQKSLKDSSDIYYGQQMGGLGQGGSIPLMGLLSQMWPQAQFVITGVLGPNSNAHGPNEFLHIDYTKKLTQCMAHVLSQAHLVKI